MHRPGEPLFDDQVEFAGLCVDVDDPELGPLRQVGPPIRFSGVEPVAARPGTGTGGADDDRLGELERGGRRRRVAEAATAGAPTIGAPLEGITVVDFASFFATAYGSKILSDLGADVIKIEPLGGDPMRPLPDPFEASQRGKRSLCIDLKSPDGQRIAARARPAGRRRDAQPPPGQGRAPRARAGAAARGQPRPHLLLPAGLGIAGPRPTSRASPRCCRASAACSTRAVAPATRRSRA